MSKKYWQLTILALYACGFSYGENNLGAARTVISREAHVPLTALAGGGALNYLLLVSGHDFRFFFEKVAKNYHNRRRC